MAKNPVCGMSVDEKTVKWKATYKGKTYYFCCQGCKVIFEANPKKYIGSRIGG